MYRFLKKIFFFVFILILSSGFGPKRIDYRKGRYNNVCKTLKDEVLIYFIFVDSKETVPWTEFDIRSTLDSMKVAVRWLEKQAAKNNISLKVKTDYYIGEEYSTIKKSLPRGSVISSTKEPNLKTGLETLNEWADNIAKRAGRSFNITEKDGIPEIKNPKNKERLVAFLRDEQKVESVALLYFVNNYFKDDISIQVNTMNTEDIEFAIVSYKYPSEIAHNVLHLFGAADLYKTPYRRNEKKIKIAQMEFPRDIMQDPYARSIKNMEINELTKYLIGWTDHLDTKYRPLLTDKIVAF